MFDQDPPFLKIFAGVGKVTVVAKEAVDREDVGKLWRFQQHGIFTWGIKA